jgi:hypothetical protein
LDDYHTASQWNEFETLGEETVRLRLGAHIWSEDKERLGRQWLEARQASISSDLAKQANALAKEANDIARSNNATAKWALIVAVVAILISIASLFLKK